MINNNFSLDTFAGTVIQNRTIPRILKILSIFNRITCGAKNCQGITARISNIRDRLKITFMQYYSYPK